MTDLAQNWLRLIVFLGDDLGAVESYLATLVRILERNEACAFLRGEIAGEH